MITKQKIIIASIVGVLVIFGVTLITYAIVTDNLGYSPSRKSGTYTVEDLIVTEEATIGTNLTGTNGSITYTASDNSSSSVVDLLTIAHKSSGYAGLDGIGTGLVFNTEADDGSATSDVSTTTFKLTSGMSDTATSSANFFTKMYGNVSGVLTELFSFVDDDIAMYASNVGIGGTFTPTSTLEVLTAGTLDFLRIGVSASGDKFIVKSNGSVGILGASPLFSLNVASSTNSGYLGIGTNGSVLAINSSGNIGIGDATPDYNLDVDGTFGAGAMVGSSTLAITGASNFYSTVGIGETFTPSSTLEILTSGSVDLFSLGVSGSGNRFIIKNNGSVGIGTTTPLYTLQMATSTNSGYLGIGLDGGKVFNVNSSGYVGINDSTPSYYLDVNGTLNVVGSSTFAGVQGDFYSGDGTAGMTGTCTASTTNGILFTVKNGLITACN